MLTWRFCLMLCCSVPNVAPLDNAPGRYNSVYALVIYYIQSNFDLWFMKVYSKWHSWVHLPYPWYALIPPCLSGPSENALAQVQILGLAIHRLLSEVEKWNAKEQALVCALIWKKKLPCICVVRLFQIWRCVQCFPPLSFFPPCHTWWSERGRTPQSAESRFCSKLWEIGALTPDWDRLHTMNQLLKI